MKVYGIAVIVLLLPGLVLGSAVRQAATINVHLEAPEVSSTGKYTVRWQNNANARLGEMQYLEESTGDGGFYTVYSGLGGSKSYMRKPEGTYIYRVRWQTCFATYFHSGYSEEITVTVDPSS